MHGFTLRVLTAAIFSLLLAGFPAQGHAERKPTVIRSAADVRCQVPKAPVIQVLPKTADIRYDFSKSTADLTARGSNTVNPYGANLDTTTGGLRSDSVRIESNIKVGGLSYAGLGVGCLWYDSVVVNINLNPVIYIAKEYQKDPCKQAIIVHEVKHVTVDREVMNKYAIEIGRAVQSAVNQAGAMGPFNLNQMDEHKKRLTIHVKSAINLQELLLGKEMRQRQAQVDSLEEYERVSKICKDVLRKGR